MAKFVLIKLCRAVPTLHRGNFGDISHILEFIFISKY